jgi:hypothetical protein
MQGAWLWLAQPNRDSDRWSSGENSTWELMIPEVGSTLYKTDGMGYLQWRGEVHVAPATTTPAPGEVFTA